MQDGLTPNGVTQCEERQVNRVGKTAPPPPPQKDGAGEGPNAVVEAAEVSRGTQVWQGTVALVCSGERISGGTETCYGMRKSLLGDLVETTEISLKRPCIAKLTDTYMPK